MSSTPFGRQHNKPGGAWNSSFLFENTLPLDVLQAAPLAIAMVEGPEHRFVFANAAYCALAPHRDSLIGRPLRDVFPDATDRNTAFIEGVYATGRPIRLRRQTIRAIPGGESGLWNVDLLPVRRKGRDVDGVILVLDDVSDVAGAIDQVTAKEIGEAGAAARRILDGVMRQMPEGMAGSESGEWGACWGREVLAEPQQSPSGQPDDQFWYLRRQDGTLAAADELPLARAIRTGEIIPIEELVLERPNGETFHILCNAGPIRDRAGNVSGGVVVCRDLSALRRLEHALRATEESLQLALESAQMGSWDLDLQTDTTRRSLRHDEIFGYPEPLPEWRRETFLSHVLADDRRAVAAAFDAAVIEGMLEFECRIRSANRGEVRWIAGRGRTHYDSLGTPVRIAGIIQDITQRKEADLVLRQARDKVEHFKKVARDEILARYERITPRQRDVLGLVVAGLSNKEIAHRLGISERTVEVHRGWVMEKMKARSIADLVRMAAAIELEPGATPPDVAPRADNQNR